MMIDRPSKSSIGIRGGLKDLPGDLRKGAPTKLTKYAVESGNRLLDT